MKVATISEFRDHATKMFRTSNPIIVTKHGKKPVGIYYPCKSSSLPKEVRWQVFMTLAGEIAQELKSKKLKEEDLLKDFENFARSHTSR